MIRKLRSGEFRLYSRWVNPKTGKRRNLGTFKSRAAAPRSTSARVFQAALAAGPSSDYFVPYMRSPASPRPGRI